MSDSVSKSGLSFVEGTAARKEAEERERAAADEWQWSCSPEIKAVLESMGLYDVMEEQMRIISTTQTKAKTTLAKEKIDALSKAVNFMKGATAVVEATGGGEADDKISDVTISLNRGEES